MKERGRKEYEEKEEDEEKEKERGLLEDFKLCVENSNKVFCVDVLPFLIQIDDNREKVGKYEILFQ